MSSFCDLFAEVYTAYRQDGFEFNLVFDKLINMEYYNDTVDIGLEKNGHEFLIETDEKSFSIIVDEETDKAVEAEIPLTDMSTMDELYQRVNAFIEEHSRERKG